MQDSCLVRNKAEYNISNFVTEREDLNDRVTIDEKEAFAASNTKQQLAFFNSGTHR